MTLYLNGRLITTSNDQQLVSKADSQGLIQINWMYQLGQLYSVVMYDINSADPPYIHLLAVNVPDNNISKGVILESYQPPSPPPGTGRHVYIIDIYRQQSRLSILPSRSRHFNIGLFESSLGLTKIVTLSFSVNADIGSPMLPSDIEVPPIDIVHVNEPLVTPVVPPKVTKGVLPDLISYKQGITRDERKYCNCLLKVQNKHGSNPYAICAHVGDRGGSGKSQCGSKYDYVKTSDEFLIAFAELHELPIPEPYIRQTMLNTIDLWKQQSGEPSIYS